MTDSCFFRTPIRQTILSLLLRRSSKRIRNSRRIARSRNPSVPFARVSTIRDLEPPLKFRNRSGSIRSVGSECCRRCCCTRRSWCRCKMFYWKMLLIENYNELLLTLCLWTDSSNSQGLLFAGCWHIRQRNQYHEIITWEVIQVWWGLICEGCYWLAVDFRFRFCFDSNLRVGWNWRWRRRTWRRKRPVENL